LRPGNNRSDELHWLVVNVDIGSVSVTDDLREALIDKIMLLVSGSSTLHIELKLGKDSRNVTMDVEASCYTLLWLCIFSILGDSPVSSNNQFIFCTCSFLRYIV
jgi:hypothetical protein